MPLDSAETEDSWRARSLNMADTGEDREIKQRANANEAEVIRESKELLRKTKDDLNTKKKAAHAKSGDRRSKAANRIAR